MSDSHYVPPTGDPADLPKVSKPTAPTPESAPKPAPAPAYRSYADELAARKAAAAAKGVNPEIDALGENFSPEPLSERKSSGTGLGLFFGCGSGCLSVFIGVSLTVSSLSAAPLVPSFIIGIFLTFILFGVGKKLGSK
ncbi:MAG: hypothetical protein ACKOWK_06595 [Micrococcales bacterium]